MGGGGGNMLKGGLEEGCVKLNIFNQGRNLFPNLFHGPGIPGPKLSLS